MCGISCTLGVTHTGTSLDHRGPDENCEKTYGPVKMRFWRLSINGNSSGQQPFVNNNKMFVCNGEIYNHKDLGGSDEVSDCLTFFNAVQKHGVYDACKMVEDSEFAMCYWDGIQLFVARDPIGIRPLFYARVKSGIIFASEIKNLLPHKAHIFPPGHVYASQSDQFACYCPLNWTRPIASSSTNNLYNTLVQTTLDKLGNSEQSIGFLLSGGLDSSLVASIGAHFSRLETIRTFTIGDINSPDVLAAKEMSEYLASVCTKKNKKYEHTHLNFDYNEGFSVIPKVIYDIESYDTTTIRASVPMWLLCRYISKNTDCKVILSGEGSDELLAGYKYFEGAPTPDSLFNETVRRVRNLHQFDVLRADRCAAAHGLELRVPFLDMRFVHECMKVCPEDKMSCRDRIEKFVLRNEFRNIVPPNILWRTKDAFSDAVGYNWITHVKELTEGLPSFKIDTHHNIPQTNEEAYYRKFYTQFFGHHNDDLISEIWRPLWNKHNMDPSARYLKN